MQKGVPTEDRLFVNGVHSDNDLLFQPPNTYRESINGRILYNKDGGYSWVNDKGNLYSFVLKEYNGSLLNNYQIIGSLDFSDKMVLFSTDNTNSEIGYIVINPDLSCTYQQVYNDKYDYNNDLLGFSLAHSIFGESVKENPDTERVYWTDNNKERKCLNILLGVSFNYTPSPLYPYWYSAQSMDRLCNWEIGYLGYSSRIDGNLKTGVYQYSYRQRTKDGYATAWSILTQPIFLNSQELVFGGNHTEYQMQPSNIVTEYGISLLIEKMDTRYPILDVAYLYSIDKTTPVEAGIFYSKEFGTKPFATQSVEHISHSAEAIPINSLVMRTRTVLTSSDTREKDNLLFDLNVTDIGILEPDLSNVIIKPKTRLVDSDTSALDNIVLPYTETPLSNSIVSIQQYTGKTIDYTVTNDYLSYQGMQYSHLFKGYWRGETYRTACLLFDMKGNPNYAFHMSDYTFPQQYEGVNDEFTLTSYEDGRYKIRIMGMDISGVRIPKEVLYDKDGKLRISGFSIVRAERVPKTLFQGVIQNTVFENNPDVDEGGDELVLITRPLPFTPNNFYVITGNNTREYYTGGILARDYRMYVNRSNTFLVYSPDLLFGYTPYPELKESDRIKLVGLVKAPISGDGTNSIGENLYYSKNYDTATTDYQSLYTLGDESSIKKTYKTPLGKQPAEHRIEGYDSDNTDFIYSQYLGTYLGAGFSPSCGAIKQLSWGCEGSMLTIAENFKDLGVYKLDSGGNYNYCQYFLVNYISPSDKYYTEDSNSLETTVYFNTGHYQKIDSGVIADTEQADGSLLFNGIEVWGGDCFVDYFDFARLLPQYNDCTTDGGCYTDYSVGLIFPVESNINHSMRFGRRYAKDGIQPEITSCAGVGIAENGIQLMQQENFDLNGVLQLQENIAFYPSKPTTITDNTDYPSQVINSQLKYYGEPIDHYRYNLFNDYLDLRGSNGKGNRLFILYNYLYFLQDRGLGRCFVNEKAIISTPEQGSVIVGSGAIFGGVIYISEKKGMQQRSALVVTENSAHFIDLNFRKWNRFAQDGDTPITDIKGLHNDLYDICGYYFIGGEVLDEPQLFGGVHGAYDYKNNEVIFTFRRNIEKRVDSEAIITKELSNRTYVYNESIGAFTGNLSILPRIYFTHRGKYFSTNNTLGNITPEKIYIHLFGLRGVYYDIVENSKLSVVFNTENDQHKVFDNSIINVNNGYTLIGETLMTTENNSELLNLQLDNRVKYKENLLRFPLRGLLQDGRVRGKYLKIDFTIVNDGLDTECKITSIESKFRISFPI
jgi:hypothetical protein